MTEADLQAMTLRLALLHAAVTAMAGVLPRDKAGGVAEAIRDFVTRQIGKSEVPDMPDAIDEQLVGDLAPLLAALDRGPGHAGKSATGAGTSPVQRRCRMTARSFMGSVRPIRCASRRLPTS